MTQICLKGNKSFSHTSCKIKKWFVIVAKSKMCKSRIVSEFAASRVWYKKASDLCNSFKHIKLFGNKRFISLNFHLSCFVQ